MCLFNIDVLTNIFAISKLCRTFKDKIHCSVKRRYYTENIHSNVKQCNM